MGIVKMKKILSILMSFLIVILTAGCAEVVYRVKPDSPPKMGIQEARDALELSLSLAQMPPGVPSVKLQGDELIMIKAATGPGASFFKAEYADVSKEVEKYEKNFAVSVTFDSSRGRRAETFYWKSEEDAASFVDAAYVLRPARFREKVDKTKIAALATPSPQKDVPREVPEPKKLTQQRESAAPVSEKGKPTAPLPSESASTKAPPVVLVDKAPPKITIISPEVSRGVKIVATASRLTVAGIAESKTGIAEVTVNGLQADLNERGHFTVDVLLKVGQNDIVVSAIDTHWNKTENHFIIHREGRKVSLTQETPIPKPLLPSANYHALFIAVENYSSGEISRLDYAVSDARRLQDILVSKYTFEKENMIFLENPDRRTIYRTLQSLRSKLNENDNLLIFYAGHGLWLEDMKQGFWLPRDASGINDPSDWIPNSNVRDYIKAIKAKHILLVADACFSGGMFRVRDAFQDQQVSIEKIYELASRKAITSGSMKTVPDRSVFLDFLVKRLRENNETYLDTQKLFASFREAVINNSPTHQTPLYGAIGETGDEGGDFIFIKRQ
jgi:hypothetical protein